MIHSRHDRELVEKFINKVAFFRDITEKYLEQIIDDFSILQAAKNEVIIVQEDSSTDLYIILTGKVKVTLMSEEGEEYILTDLHVGDYFGEMSLIDGKPRCATVVAVEDSTFAVLKRERLIEALKRDPLLSLDMLSTLVHKLRKATEREESLAFLDVRERLLRLFGELIKEEGKKEESGFYRIGKRTQKELALRIGASREATSQILRALAFEKIIKEKDTFFLIAPTVCTEDFE
ncbi:MAG: Crp/Fnr family transcriptional regulator [Planctomycetes bacterium]|nr:Crp/Fnr family transcriptional regulator [Planctomycetota bacterium]